MLELTLYTEAVISEAEASSAFVGSFAAAVISDAMAVFQKAKLSPPSQTFFSSNLRQFLQYINYYLERNKSSFSFYG